MILAPIIILTHFWMMSDFRLGIWDQWLTNFIPIPRAEAGFIYNHNINKDN